MCSLDVLIQKYTKKSHLVHSKAASVSAVWGASVWSQHPGAVVAHTV